MNTSAVRPITLTLIAIVLLVALTPFILPGVRNNLKHLSESAHFGCFATGGTALLDCIEKDYVQTTNDLGPVGAMTNLRADYAQYPTVTEACHQFAHAIGRTAARNNPSLSELFTRGDSFCWSGYYHGVIEGLLRGTNISAMNETRVRTFCDAVAPPAQAYFDYFNCVHGVGHALMYVSNNDLPESLVHCAYYEDPNDETNCAAGIFMENILSRENGHGTDYVVREDPFYACRFATSTTVGAMCHDVQATQIVIDSGYGAGAFAVCAQVSDEQHKASCYHGVGREISAHTLYDTKRTFDMCSIAGAGATQCILGAAKNFVAYYHGDTEARLLCGNTPESDAKACNTAVTALAALQTKTGD